MSVVKNTNTTIALEGVLGSALPPTKKIATIPTTRAANKERI
ncbi:hypothetical protein [Haloprofundus marisrubri]|nr:hypothetical protein [Haloprofundus marisrubri]